MTADASHREWRRYTPRERLGRYALYFGIGFACVLSLRTVQIIPEFLYDAPEQMADLHQRPSNEGVRALLDAEDLVRYNWLRTASSMSMKPASSRWVRGGASIMPTRRQARSLTKSLRTRQRY